MKKIMLALVLLFCIVIPGCERGDCQLCDDIRAALQPNHGWTQPPYVAPEPPKK